MVSFFKIIFVFLYAFLTFFVSINDVLTYGFCKAENSPIFHYIEKQKTELSLLNDKEIYYAIIKNNDNKITKTSSKNYAFEPLFSYGNSVLNNLFRKNVQYTNIICSYFNFLQYPQNLKNEIYTRAP